MTTTLDPASTARHRSRHRRRRSTVLIAAVLAAVGATCGSALSAKAADHVASGETVTLELSYVNDPIGAAVIEAFEAAHPNIDIEASIVPFSDYVSTIRLTMASDSAPDIAQYNAGAMRTLIPAGHL